VSPYAVSGAVSGALFVAAARSSTGRSARDISHWRGAIVTGSSGPWLPNACCIRRIVKSEIGRGNVSGDFIHDAAEEYEMHSLTARTVALIVDAS
jgi:hypothetical protein